jgi:hypothetical protein
MYRHSILAVVFTCTIAPAIQAARLTEVEGNVLVNKGDGFWEVNNATPVSAGDRVLVRGKGTAKIDYGNGCVKKISANQTTVVTSKPVCDPAPVAAQKQPVAKAAVSLKETPAAAAAIGTGVPDNHLAIFGGVMAAATGAVLLASQGGDGDNDGEKGEKGDDKQVEAPAPADAALMVDTMMSTAAAVPLDAEPVERITVVDSMVVAKTEAAATALDGGDTTEGLPASP